MTSQIRSLAFALTAIAPAILAAGCGQPEAPPPPVEETVFGDAVGTLDRARAVEDITQQQKRALDAAIEASEGARSTP